MIETSEQIVALTAAIIKVQGGISGVHKNAKNPHFKSSYATLENVIDTARPALQEAGIAFVQAPGMVIDGSVEVTTMLVHSSGEWMKATLHVPLGKRDPQGVGSAITYGCRYSLMAMLGLPPTDDDGEAAMERPGSSTPNTVTGPATRTSSAALKRDDIWPQMEHDISECRSVASLMTLRGVWAKTSGRDKWPPAWCDAAAETFDKAEAVLRKLAASEPDDDDTFPGDRPTRRDLSQHPLNAG
ncbi:hypothetical protein EJ076_34975 [Mesorhizobium sp. M7D.F.Ca.US.005.01.1.1]|uniref:ERF family protein n=1 Tax=Mesorhizobium sp. M7D.F.Ca.US.005.01.1.1 TaxID=2493678 RepID=UPI000F750A05|nr:ERF family protein [Mesorhizobium sp. M7D.F.Ca.US.005.01.1.1]AZO39690.1 hypothetical protein EJ076_00020 [Mesorhizobium sp. M7D.F.Ca.US.005.01.1.1]AZO45920.1 hypothetical protein EJ076_34975 [Mesorhizobium sp. M7D.F.Ca.US.005.01.1.1]